MSAAMSGFVVCASLARQTLLSPFSSECERAVPFIPSTRIFLRRMQIETFEQSENKNVKEYE